MEDPIMFDLWACVLRGNGKQAIEEMFDWCVNNPTFPEFNLRESRFAVNRSMVQGESVQIARRRTWSQAQSIRTNPPAWAQDIRLYQEGYEPEKFIYPRRFKGSCEVHDFFYGGCLGCHVCRGFFIT